MTIILAVAVVAIIAALYIYGALSYYYAFKTWHPLCGCQGTACVQNKQG